MNFYIAGTTRALVLQLVLVFVFIFIFMSTISHTSTRQKKRYGNDNGNYIKMNDRRSSVLVTWFEPASSSSKIYCTPVRVYPHHTGTIELVKKKMILPCPIWSAFFVIVISSLRSVYVLQREERKKR